MCPELVKTEYIHRHNKAAAHMHWAICKEFGIEVKERWYEHEPKTVTWTRRIKSAFSLIWLYPSTPTPQSKPRKSLPIQRPGNGGWANVGAQNNNSPGGYGSPWHHQEGHGKLHQQNPWQHQHTWTPENNSPFYSPPSEVGPLHQVETLFTSLSPRFGLGCWDRKSIAITLVYLIL